MKMQENNRLTIHGFQGFEVGAGSRIEFEKLSFTMSAKSFLNQLQNRMETGHSRVLLINKDTVKKTHMTYFGSET